MAGYDMMSQGINSNGEEKIPSKTGPCLLWGRILTASVISVLKNDRKSNDVEKYVTSKNI